MKRKIIAVTGGIGSGKSQVAKILNDCGYNVIDCDNVSRIVSSSSQVIDAVRLLLGDNAIIDGQLNRKYIRSVIFDGQNKQILHEYNDIFTLQIKSELQRQIDGCNGDAVFVEIPLIGAFEFAWDEVWLVQSNLQSRVKRIIARDNVDEKSALDVINSQVQVTNYTRVIDNNGSLQDLQRQVLSAVSSIS